MPESRTLSARAGRTWQNLRAKGALSVARALLIRVGVRITPYYWVEERPPTDIPAELMTLPDGFTCRELGRDEVVALTPPPEGEPGSHEYALLAEAVAEGSICLGIFRGAELVAFTLSSTDKSMSRFHPVELGPTQAYLHNMYVVPTARGHNLAGILRNQNYQALRALGRNTFYSVTVASNTASWRFKEKLNARKVLLGLHVNIFNRWTLRPVLKRY